MGKQQETSKGLTVIAVLMLVLCIGLAGIVVSGTWEKIRLKNVHFTLIYDPNGGNGHMEDQEIKYGESTQIYANEFTNGDYSFMGWNAYRKSDEKWLVDYDNGSGTKQVWFTEEEIEENGYTKHVYRDKTTLSKTSDVNGDKIIMRAVWSIQTYTIVYHPNGGQGSMDDQVITFGVPTPLSANRFTLDGSNFLGWAAHRVSDDCWFVADSSGSKSWVTADKVDAGGYTYVIYDDKTEVSKSSFVADDVIDMYAMWD